MLQIDHIYEFLYKNIFTNVEFWFSLNGVINSDISNIRVFTLRPISEIKIFFYDQEPFIPILANPYMAEFTKDDPESHHILVTSEFSQEVNNYSISKKFLNLYYFFHGFAALDWYRGHYALNYNKSIVKQYKYDFISFNRIINSDLVIEFTL